MSNEFGIVKQVSAESDLKDLISNILAQPVAIFILGLAGVYATEFTKALAKRHEAKASAFDAWTWMRRNWWKTAGAVAGVSLAIWWLFGPCHGPREDLSGEQFLKCETRWLQL